MKRKLLSAALIVVSALGFHANAEVDVTSSYIGRATTIIGGGHKLSDAAYDTGDGYFSTQSTSAQNFRKNPIDGITVETAVESWSNKAAGEGFILARIAVLPQGKYTLKFKAMAQAQEQYGNAPFDKEKTVVKCGDQELQFNNNTTGQEYSFDIDVTNANTSYIFGIYQKEGGSANWAGMGDISLTLNSENVIPVSNTDGSNFNFQFSNTEKENNRGGYAVNTWSWEGNRDGTNFLTPFIQVHTDKSNGNLDDATITGTYNPDKTGVYKVSAWVRAYNESGGAVTGAKIFVADAETDACTGTTILNGRLGTYTAMADGVAGTPFNYGFVIENAKINWLAFKNVTITYLGDLPEEEITALMEQIPSGKMNATVKATLDGYVNALNSNKSVANYNNLSLYLPTAKASADVYVTIDNAIKSYAEKVATLSTEAQNAYDASNVQTKYDNGTYETLEEAEKDLAAALAIAIKSQKTVGSDWTGLIINPSFETGNLTGWTNTGMETQNNTSFPKTGTYYAQSWQPNGTKSISQTIVNMPAGVYRLSALVKARDVASAKIYVNDVEQLIAIADKEDTYNVDFACSEGNDITLGFTGVGTGGGWMAMDNFTLTFLGTEYPAIEAVEGKMNKEVAAKQSEALDAYNSEKNVTTYNAASNAVAAAKGSIAAYSKMKSELDRVLNEVSTTNVYTADAYKANYTDKLAAWTDETISTEDANAYTFGSRTTGAGAAILLSPWTIGDKSAKEDGSLYINTWSTEGNNDGSNFQVPFFECWTADANSLEANTFTATQKVSLANGFYKVTAWVRVRAANDKTKVANKIQFSVGEGTPEDVVSGKQVGDSRFYIGEYTAYGFANDEGILTIKFDVAAESNVSWLAFKNVKWEAVEETVTIGKIGYATFSSEYPLDLSNIEGGTAYIVADKAAEDGSLKLTEQTEAVPANTGLLIAGEEGTVTIPVTATANPLEKKNYLEAGKGEKAPVDSYVLSCKYADGGEEYDLETVGFYVVTDYQPIVEKGKAYLYFQEDPVPAKALYFVFGDDNATSVEAIEVAETEADGALYNVAGQQVGKDYKGIVIKNGKKYLNK